MERPKKKKNFKYLIKDYLMMDKITKRKGRFDRQAWSE